jgi:RNA-directed DNA polymerase
VASIEFPDLLTALFRSDPDSMCNKIFGIDFKKLAKQIYPKPKYRVFLLKKRSGGVRIIAQPRASLKLFQHKFLEFLYQNSGDMKRCVHGFTEGRSVVTNARQHSSPRTRFVFNADIEDFSLRLLFIALGVFFRRGRLASRFKTQPYSRKFPASTERFRKGRRPLQYWRT